QLESGIEQFFHVYPFGVVETYLDGTASNQIPGYDKVLQSILPPTQEQVEWNKNERGGQLVDAHNLLFPQFTWTGSYSGFELSSTDETEQPPFDLNNVAKYSTQFANDTSGINQYSGPVEEEGSLFIGLENLQPLQSVSLLFQFAEGSAADEDDDPPPIHWSFLSNNEWKPLKDENLISDSTQGFQTTGIVQIDVPADATTHNTVITDGLLWFCASVTSNSDRIPQLVGVVAQAVAVTFEDKGNDQSHFDKPLPAGSIGKLAITVNEVSKVTQPFASFDGKHTEIGKEFYTRVSERLRHKGRAVTAWDYEHLVLDRFPSIYKVKCITHTDPNCLCRNTETVLVNGQSVSGSECCGAQIAPGHILIVPISDLKNRNAVNPLQPKTGRKTLLDIEAYLQKLTSPFVKVHAKNPVYEQIIVAFRVQFTEGINRGYYLKKLNEEIVYYLTPWAFDANADVKFDQKIYASSIIYFIESRSYVDFITDFFMGVCPNECCPEIKTPITNNAIDSNAINSLNNCNDLEQLLGNTAFIGETEVAPSTSRSILVSVAQHVIIPYEAPVIPSPCELRKLNMGAMQKSITVESSIQLAQPSDNTANTDNVAASMSLAPNPMVANTLVQTIDNNITAKEIVMPANTIVATPVTDSNAAPIVQVSQQSLTQAQPATATESNAAPLAQTPPESPVSPTSLSATPPTLAKVSTKKIVVKKAATPAKASVTAPTAESNAAPLAQAPPESPVVSPTSLFATPPTLAKVSTKKIVVKKATAPAKKAAPKKTITKK
ncbi:MAG: hypothetical protein LBE82_06915, partial [Chitinophagaceae bacterium]|nr:hypothetical protein [Chitinophagaceae bacterium]